MTRHGDNKISNGALVGILVVVVIAVLYASGKLGTTPLSVGTPSPSVSGAPPTNQSFNAAACPNYAQNFLITVQYPDYTKNPVAFTAVGSQTINLYAQPTAGVPAAPTSPSTSVTVTGTSSATSGTAIASLNCGVRYLITAGDNSGYFLNGTYQNIGYANNKVVYINAAKYSNVKITGANTIQASPANVLAATVKIQAASASSTQTGYLIIQGGQYTSSEGPQCVSFAYNAQAIQSVSIGLPVYNGPCPAMAFLTSNTAETELSKIGSQNTQVNYLIPSLSNYQYSTATGTSVAAYEIPVVATLTASFTINEAIGVQVTPGTGFFSTVNGTLLSLGTTGSVVYKNPQTGLNIFTPIQGVSSNAFIITSVSTP